LHSTSEDETEDADTEKSENMHGGDS
jgi:hypothetical protein